LLPDESLVVIHDLDLIGSGIRPHEADAVLVVNANAVLAFSISDQSFEPIAGRNSQLV